ncbi:MAG TPA: YifB family Mg chelatase-like AAA ATPase [Oculatellaceae cyanobacterium]
MFSRVYSGGLLGVDAYRIEVEVDCSSGIGQIQLVGLPDTSVKESQERVRAAIKACAFLVPPGKKWVVNLAPAYTRKEGPAYDLPIAIGVLASTELIPTTHLGSYWLIGELSLDGSIRPVSGVLPIALAAKEHGALGIVVPEENAEEAALVEGLTVYPVSHLQQVCTIMRAPSRAAKVDTRPRDNFRQRQGSNNTPDFRDVRGQVNAKRALQIAAAGHHNVLMVGPPGAGKSMLAQRLPSIMPPLSFEEALELTKLYSVAGLLKSKTALVLDRPFRAPHHSASAVGLVGGGSVPKPGEISLSHKGILFLDELTEFPRSHLETLRQPLETASVTISRVSQTLTYPANFLLVGACNPCPCGYRNDPLKYCSCSPGQADRYWSRLSGPLLDRIDLQIEVARLKENELAQTFGSETSEMMRLRVERAVRKQRQRSGGNGSFVFNGHLSQREIAKHCQIDEKSRIMLAKAITHLGLSARAYDRVLRIARTIADLDDHPKIQPEDIAEAIRYRTLSQAS